MHVVLILLMTYLKMIRNNMYNLSFKMTDSRVGSKYHPEWQTRISSLHQFHGRYRYKRTLQSRSFLDLGLVGMQRGRSRRGRALSSIHKISKSRPLVICLHKLQLEILLSSNLLRFCQSRSTSKMKIKVEVGSWEDLGKAQRIMTLIAYNYLIQIWSIRKFYQLDQLKDLLLWFLRRPSTNLHQRPDQAQSVFLLLREPVSK